MVTNVTANEEDLLDACYLTYGSRRSTGAVLNAYMDHLGYPTIGCGHLIFRPNMSESEIARYRKRHIDRMGHVGINREQAGREFDALVYACQHGTVRTQMVDGVRVITYPKMTPLTTPQAEKLFRRDQRRAYNNALRYFPDLHTYPVEVQTCLVHLGSHGSNLGTVKRLCGKDLSPENITAQMVNLRAHERESISINAACELYYACEAVGIEPPQKIIELKRKNPSTFATYEKNILAPIREKWGNGVTYVADSGVVVEDPLANQSVDESAVVEQPVAGHSEVFAENGVVQASAEQQNSSLDFSVIQGLDPTKRDCGRLYYLLSLDPAEANMILGQSGSSRMNSAELRQAWNNGTLSDEQKLQLYTFALRRFNDRGIYQDVEGCESASFMQNHGRPKKIPPKEAYTPEQTGNTSVGNVMMGDRQRAMDMLVQVGNTLQNDVVYQSDASQLTGVSFASVTNSGRNSGR